MNSPSSKWRRRWFLAGAVSILAGCAGGRRRPVVLAAASLQPWLAPLVDRFGLTVSYGGSRALVQQASQGTPCDLLLLADELEVPSGFASPTPFGGNRLVLVARARACSLDELSGPGKVAVGDPKLAPVGRYAEAALAYLKKGPNLVLTRDDRASLTLLDSGHVDLAIVYRSDLQGRPGAVFPRESHAPIQYWASPRGSLAEIEGFLKWLGSAEGRVSLEKAGFSGH